MSAGTRRAARAVREHASKASQRRDQEFSRGRVVGRSPLRVELAGSGLVLEEDDDFALSAGLDAYDDEHTIKTGDTLLLAHEDGDFTAFDVEPAKRPRRANLTELKRQVTDAVASITETKALRKTFELNGTTLLDLGPIKGDKITAVRFNFTGRVHQTGGQCIVRLRPNGLTSTLGQIIGQRTYFDGSNALEDRGFTGLPGVGDGIGIWINDWVSTAGTRLGAAFEGTFYPARGPSDLGAFQLYREYIGVYTNRDYTVDGNRTLHCSFKNTWMESTTEITGLKMACTNGALYGRLSMEIIP